MLLHLLQFLLEADISIEIGITHSTMLWNMLSQRAQSLDQLNAAILLFTLLNLL